MIPAKETVLVTGATGFVGACLVRDLVDAGHDVHLLHPPGSAGTWRLAGLDGRYTWHAADLRDASAVRRAVDACGPQVVYHLTAHAVAPARRDGAAGLAAHLLGTANLLEALEGHEYRAFVHAGSSAEYGPGDAPRHEDDRPQPCTDDGVAGAAATLRCQAEALKGRPVCTVRLFAAYGPWEDPARLVPHVMGCCQRGEAPQVTAGRQRHDFIHVDDVLTLLNTAADTPCARGQVLHAGTGQGHTVAGLVETIVRVCAGGPLRQRPGTKPCRADDPAPGVAAIERTMALTGWRPQYDLASGVECLRTWSTGGRHALAA
jgi:dolichol-phosphate mannosyltransferase